VRTETAAAGSKDLRSLVYRLECWVLSRAAQAARSLAVRAVRAVRAVAAADVIEGSCHGVGKVASTDEVVLGFVVLDLGGKDIGYRSQTRLVYFENMATALNSVTPPVTGGRFATVVV
jgi:hypothetical protein